MQWHQDILLTLRRQGFEVVATPFYVIDIDPVPSCLPVRKSGDLIIKNT